MSKIKILEPTLKNFSGQMYGVQFKKGESLTELNDRQLMSIGASMRVVALGGEKQITPTQAHRDLLNVGANTLAKEKPAQKVKPTVVEANAKQTFDKIYTREELEAVADKQGIKGIRELAGTMKVKGRAIEELIEGILVVQGNQ